MKANEKNARHGKCRTKLHIIARALLTACLPLLLVATLFTSTASAWFYFPNPKTVTIVTAPGVPMQLTVWRLENSGTPTLYLATETDGTSTIPISLDMSFFRWGSRYFSEGDEATYYAFEFVYDSDVFFTSGSRLPLNGLFSADLTYSASNEAGQPYQKNGNYLRFPFYTISYAIGSDAGVAFTGHTALLQAQGASYTDLIGQADLRAEAVTDSTNATGSISRTYLDETLQSLAPARYKQVVTTESGQTNRLRLILYVRVQADMDYINTALSGNVDMNDTYLMLNTDLTLQAEFQTVPAYTGGN